MNGFLEPLQQLLEKILPDLGKQNAKASIQVTETDTGLDVMLELPSTVAPAAYYEDMVSLARGQDLARLSVVGYGLVYMARTPAIKVGPVEIPTLADGFLQASSEGEHLLIGLLQQALEGQEDLKILELFSGIGTFTVPLAKHGNVTAYEGAPEPVEILKQVAKRYQLPVETHVRDLFKRPLATDELKHYDIVVLDPPRLGAIHQCRQLAEASHLSKIIYIACHPKTFARDARILQKGGWKLTQLNLVDQFLWSQHMELFSVWERG
jgi:23S rRNA (uracil1939-C5)-methyltransferase